MAETFKQNQDVFSFVKTEETAFQRPVKISEGYEWSMAKHIKLGVLYPLSQYETGNSEDKPFKQIIQPILNIQYRAEGFDVKDIILFVNDRKNNHKSFLVKKFHEKYVRENDLDAVIDDSIEGYVDMGGTLIKCVSGKLPEAVPLQRIAFCDQTDILSGPICEKHSYSPDQLKEMEKAGWGDEGNGATMTIDELIALSGSYKITDPQNTPTETPGKYIEVYELHGVLPVWWLKEGEEEGFVRQLQIISFYKNSSGEKQFVCLFKGKEQRQIYEFEKRVRKVYGRALGMGGVEELTEAQVWTNYSAIRMKDMLEAASKVLFQTSDKTFAKRQNLKNAQNLQIFETREGHPVNQINTTPVNIRLFENSVNEWWESAKTIASASESIMGEQPASGTPFKLQELITAEAHSFHEYKKGKLAKFWERIYRNHIIPTIIKEINKGQEFLATLDLSEMQELADKIAARQARKQLSEKVLSLKTIMGGEEEALKERLKNEFMAGGNKKFIKLIKEELKDTPVDIEINIVGKQKYLAETTDKLVNVIRFMLSTWNPNTGTFAVFDDPRMTKVFENIIEYSGLNPMDFYAPPKTGVTPPMTQPTDRAISGTATKPLQELGRPESLAQKVR